MIFLSPSLCNVLNMVCLTTHLHVSGLSVFMGKVRTMSATIEFMQRREQ